MGVVSSGAAEGAWAPGTPLTMK